MRAGRAGLGYSPRRRRNPCWACPACPACCALACVCRCTAAAVRCPPAPPGRPDHPAAQGATSDADPPPALRNALPILPACSGTIYSVKLPDIKFVLPGGPGYSASHLQRIAEAAAELAAQEDLLPVAWEVAGDDGAWPRAGGPRGRFSCCLRAAAEPACQQRVPCGVCLVASEAGRELRPCWQQAGGQRNPGVAPLRMAHPSPPRPTPAAGAFPVFTVPQMADFLFNRADPAACMAALRLLRDDRLYFKQVSQGRRHSKGKGGWGKGGPACLPARPAV